MIETGPTPAFNPEDLERPKKKRGISAILWLRNERGVLELANSSILAVFDEPAVSQCVQHSLAGWAVEE